MTSIRSGRLLVHCGVRRALSEDQPDQAEGHGLFLRLGPQLVVAATDEQLQRATARY